MKNKLPLLLGGGVAAALVALVVGLTTLAHYTERNIPLFSAVDEKIVNLQSEEDFQADVQENLELVTDVFLDELDSYDPSNPQKFAEALRENPKLKELGVAEDVTSARIKTKFDIDIDMDIAMDDPTLPDALQNIAFKGLITTNADTIMVKKDKDAEMVDIDSAIDVTYKAQGTTLEGKGDMRIVDDTLYLRLRELPSFGYELEDIMNEWYFLDLKELEKQTAEMTEQNEDIDFNLTPRQKEQIRDFVKSGVLSKHVKRLPQEVHDGKRTNCYAVELDSDDVYEIIEQGIESSDSADELSASDMREIRDLTDAVDEVNLKFCTGKRSHYLYATDASIKINYSEDGNDLHLTLAAQARYSDINDDTLSVKAPKDATDLMDLFNSAMSGYDADTYDYGDSTYDYEDEDWYKVDGETPQHFEYENTYEDSSSR